MAGRLGCTGSTVSTGCSRYRDKQRGSTNWRPAVALAALIDRPASCSSNRRWYKQKDPLHQVQQKRVFHGNLVTSLAALVKRPASGLNRRLMKFSVFLPFQKFKGSFDPRSQFLQATLIEPFAHRAFGPRLITKYLINDQQFLGSTLRGCTGGFPRSFSYIFSLCCFRLSR